MVYIYRDLARVSEESWYLPAANLYFHFFSLIPGQLSSTCSYSCQPSGLVWYAARTLNGFPLSRKISYLVGIFLISHPFLIGVDRANLDLHLVLCLILFVFFYERPARRPHEQILAALGLGLAGAFKIFPLLFGAIYLKDRRYKELGLTGLIFILLTALTAQLQGGIFRSGLALLRHFGEADQFDVRLGARFNLGLQRRPFLSGRLQASGGYAHLRGVVFPVFRRVARRRLRGGHPKIARVVASSDGFGLRHVFHSGLVERIPLVDTVATAMPLYSSAVGNDQTGLRNLRALRTAAIPKGHLIIYYFPDVGSFEAGLATPTHSSTLSCWSA